MAGHGQHLETVSGSEAQVVLRLLGTHGIGTRTLGRILDDVIRQQESFEELPAMTCDQMTDRFGLNRETAEAFLANEQNAATLFAELEQRYVKLLVRGTAAYPESLATARGGDAPPVLFGLGNLVLLQRLRTRSGLGRPSRGP